MSLAKRSIRSVTWNTLASLISLPLSFIQSIMLARLLPVDYFGIFVGVSSIVNLSSVFFEFGLSSAFLHRSEETRDEAHAAGVYFCLRLILNSIWLVLLIGAGLIFFTGTRQWVLIFMAGASYLTFVAAAPEIILIRRVEHRRMAAIDLATSLSTAILSILIAYYYRSIWALLISSFMTLLFSFLGLHIIKPVTSLKPIWDRTVARYFLSFGYKSLSINILDSALDNIDNIWTNYFLGDRWLGYYSRAYRFAIYPRTLLTIPISLVSLGMFAELKYDRLNLSKAFFRVSFLLTSLGFFISGLLNVIAPLFIVIFLGEKWLPMLGAFRLLLLFSLLDPLRVITSGLLVGIGKPERVTRIRIVQLVILIGGLFLLGLRYQIVGVALAIDLMVLIGVVLSIRMVRGFVDFSLLRLFGPQLVSLIAGIALDQLLIRVFALDQPDIVILIFRSISFSIGYFGMMGLLEGKMLYRSLIELSSSYPMLQKVLSKLHIASKEGE
jgi:O-antigen/teichoic acid export membrane protein